MKSISTEEALLLSWKSCLDNKKSIAITSALGIGAYFFVLGGLYAFARGYGIGIFIALLFFIIAVLFQIGFIKIALNISGNKTITLSLLYKQYTLFIRYIMGCVFYASLVLVGLLLFILPGVVWAVRYSMWPFVMVNKDVDILTSFTESKQITKGQFSSLLLLYLALIGGLLISILPLGVGLFISYPVAILTLACTYRKLQVLFTSKSLHRKKKKKKVVTNPY